MLLGFLSLACGMILDSVARARRETKHLVYLSVPPLEFRDQAETGARGMQSRLTESWPQEEPATERGNDRVKERDKDRAKEPATTTSRRSA